MVPYPACNIYLLITTFSLPALAVYDAGAALCRSIGKTNVTMYISIAANVVNVVGNCVGVFALKMGAAGVAYPSLISRVLSARQLRFTAFPGKIRCSIGWPMCSAGTVGF